MVIVSNTSPISNLAKIGQLTLLQQLYGTILIPTAVHTELLDPRAGTTIIQAVQTATYIQVQSVQNQELVDRLLISLNIGEAEAIGLASEIQATHLLIDERLGRQTAKNLRLKVTGVLGILLAAKNQGLIPFVQPVMDSLISQANFWISQQLYAKTLKAANE